MDYDEYIQRVKRRYGEDMDLLQCQDGSWVLQRVVGPRMGGFSNTVVKGRGATPMDAVREYQRYLGAEPTRSRDCSRERSGQREDCIR